MSYSLSECIMSGVRFDCYIKAGILRCEYIEIICHISPQSHSLSSQRVTIQSVNDLPRGEPPIITPNQANKEALFTRSLPMAVQEAPPTGPITELRWSSGRENTTTSLRQPGAPPTRKLPLALLITPLITTRVSWQPEAPPTKELAPPIHIMCRCQAPPTREWCSNHQL